MRPGTKWKYRLPLYAATVFVLMSAPFLLGYPGPSLHENLYSVIFMMINSIALLAVFALADPVAALFAEGNPDFDTRVTLGLMLAFYVIAFFAAGCLIDFLQLFGHRRMNWIPILRYFEFWDVPRGVVLRYQGRLYFLDAPFQEEKDEYSKAYAVYRLPPWSDEEVRDLDSAKLFAFLESAEVLTTIPVRSLTLDRTGRRAFSEASLAALLPRSSASRTRA